MLMEAHGSSAVRGKHMTEPKGTKKSSKKDGVTKTSADGLFKSVSVLSRFSAALVQIGEDAPERMTLSQVIFFMHAATADLAGGRPIFKDIKAHIGPKLGKSLHTTYGIFMEPSRSFPHALGWLEAEVNPMDKREKFLRLTTKGRNVVRAIVHQLDGTLL